MDSVRRLRDQLINASALRLKTLTYTEIPSGFLHTTLGDQDVTQIIALTSTRGQSGKDTLCDLLVQSGFTVVRVAFGDVLKENCARVLSNGYDMDEATLIEWFHSDQKDRLKPSLAIKDIPNSNYRNWLMFKADQGTDMDWVNAMRTPRWHLQKFGTEFSREYMKQPDIWLNEGLKKITEATLGKPDFIVVSDLRQENEYQALYDLGAKLVRLQRMWFKPGVDDVAFHGTDVVLTKYEMDALVLNEWNKPMEMLTQLREQGVLPK
jgi:hypothetical protein